MRALKKLRRTGGRAVSASVVSVFILVGRMAWSGGEYLQGGWRGAWISTAAAFAFALLILPFFAVVWDAVQYVGEKRSLPGKTVKIVLSLVLCAAALLTMLSILREATRFVTIAMGIDKNEKMIAVILVFVAALLAVSGDVAVKKFTFVTLAYTALCAAALLILSAGRGGDAENLRAVISEGAIKDGTDTDAIKRAFCGVFAPCALGAAWLSLTAGKRRKQTVSVSETLIGVIFGGITLAICFLTVVFSLGAAYASVREFPYLSAVGALTAGKLFMRPEGVVWIAYLMSVLGVLAICISLICRVADGGRSKKLPFAAAAVMTVVCLFVL